jgi:2Fe-2S ferredoxin
VRLLGNNFYLDGRRLSCQLYCFGEMTVDVSEHLGQDHLLKKIRGFRRADQLGISQAVQGIMLLDQEKKS